MVSVKKGISGPSLDSSLVSTEIKETFSIEYREPKRGEKTGGDYLLVVELGREHTGATALTIAQNDLPALNTGACLITAHTFELGDLKRGLKTHRVRCTILVHLFDSMLRERPHDDELFCWGYTDARDIQGKTRGGEAQNCGSDRPTIFCLPPESNCL